MEDINDNDINEVLSYKNIDSNDNKDYLNIDKSKYALKDNFNPNNSETVTAREIASKLGDTQNFAFYRSVVQKIGEQRAGELLSETKEDIRMGGINGQPIRNPAALFNWKVQQLLKGRE